MHITMALLYALQDAQLPDRSYRSRACTAFAPQTGVFEHLRRTSIPTLAMVSNNHVQQLRQGFGERPLRRRGGNPQPMPTAVLFGVNYSCRLSMLLHRCCLTDAYRMPCRTQPVCGQPARYDCSTGTATAPAGTLSLPGSSIPTGTAPR